MLARTSDEVANPDWVEDLLAACARQAIRDYTSGVAVCGPKHFDSAVRFLTESGLIHRVPPPPVHTGPRQLDLFGD